MRFLAAIAAAAAAALIGTGRAEASAIYWSLFNLEGESTAAAQYVTYGSLTDMLTDQNRLGVFDPVGGSAGNNIVGSGSSGTTYWNLFNFEGESTAAAQYVTYGSLADMLTDNNRLGVFDPVGGFAGNNIVGSGSDGTTYWNLFNFEGESTAAAQYVTYGSRADMLTDNNRLGVFDPVGGFAGNNIVGSGSDGTTYWNLFNFEGESTAAAQYVTYGSRADMLTDNNRLGVFDPVGGFAGNNIVGSGATLLSNGTVPEPGTLALLGLGLAGLCAARWRKR